MAISGVSSFPTTSVSKAQAEFERLSHEGPRIKDKDPSHRRKDQPSAAVSALISASDGAAKSGVSARKLDISA